jgi:uncharacterized protein YfdQ (DUF2303 family)
MDHPALMREQGSTLQMANKPHEPKEPPKSYDIPEDSIIDGNLSANPEARLLVSRQDMLDRIVELGRNANALQIIDLVAPEDSFGIPTKIPALITHGPQPHLKGFPELFEPYRTAPKRREGIARATTLQSFIDLTNRHKDEHSVIFAKTQWPEPKLTAVIDYHQADHAPRFGKHKVEYAFPLTEEFKAWIEANGKVMSQGDFASFVEDRVAELAAPYDTEAAEYERLFKTTVALPNEMVNLSRGLQVHVAASVKHNVVLQSGEGEIQFTEEHQNSLGEKITVPGVFMISVPAFQDGEPVRIPARLRYRVREGKIIWHYQLYKWDFWLRVRVKNDLEAVAVATLLPYFEGSPEFTNS